MADEKAKEKAKIDEQTTIPTAVNEIEPSANNPESAALEQAADLVKLREHLEAKKKEAKERATLAAISNNFSAVGKYAQQQGWLKK